MAPRVLLVDDDAPLREVLQEALQEAGFRVVTAADGVEALELLRRGDPYDVLLLDDEMPRLGGRQLLALLRAAGSRIPVVLCSGSLDLDEDQRRRLGVGPVLRKPFPLASLAEVLRRVMDAGPEG